MPNDGRSGSPITKRAEQFKIDHIRPFQQGEYRPNDDGSYSTEVTVTVPDGQGSWVNVPSLWMSPGGWVELDEDQAAQAASIYESRSGVAFPRFKTVDDAEQIASTRSHSGGIANGALAHPMGNGYGGLGGLGGIEP